MVGQAGAQRAVEAMGTSSSLQVRAAGGTEGCAEQTDRPVGRKVLNCRMSS